MIFKIATLLSLIFSFSYSAPLKKENDTQKKLETKTIYEVKLKDLTPKDTDTVLKSAISNLDFITTIPVCGQVYESRIDSSGRFVENERFKKIVDPDEYETIIEDFNPNTGDFKCSYVSKNKFPNKIISTNSLSGWKSRLAMIKMDKDTGLNVVKEAFRSARNGDIATGDYWIPLLNQFVAKKSDRIHYDYNRNNFNVYSVSKKLGIWIDSKTNLSKLNKSFTLSQFLINLITLNSEFVVGVDGYGNIKINKDVEKRLTILHEQDGDGAGFSDLTKLKDEWLSEGLTGLFFGSNKDNIARKKYTDANSFADYFDYKLFGMYYNFMGIAWSNIFSYASMLFLSFMVLYSGVVVGAKYGVHKLDEDMNGRPFEFPAKIRLISIGAILVLSFVQFPSGDGLQVTGKDGEVETIQAQTSIAKIAISYLGNIGTVIADVSSGTSVTVYLDYLLKATNSQSYKQIQENIKEYEKEVALQAVRVAFFSKECILPYEDKMFKREKSFQGVNSDSIDEWEWDGEEEAKKLFAEGTENPSVSPYLCKKMEKNIAITRKVLKAHQNIIEKNMSNRLKTTKTGQTELSTLFVMTQLQATKSLGWINIATLPILHVFMMNSGIIGDGVGLGKRGDGEVKSMILDGTLHEQQKNQKQLGDEAKDYLKGQNLDGLFNTGILDGFIVWILSKQVYSILPGFDDTRKGIQIVIKGSVETLIDLVGKIVKPAKALQIAKKIGDFITSSDAEASAGVAVLLYIASFALAILVYKIMLSAIFSGMVSLLVILKIVLYFVDVFAYFFVSPLIVGWKLTINDRTDRVHRYITSGFVLLMLRPTLIVFSSVMFIVAYEVMLSIYSLSFDMIFSSLELANDLYDESDMGSLMMMGAIKGFGEVIIYVFGMILAYHIILNGDDMILQKFGYKDDTDNGMANQIGGKIQGIAGAKI